MIGEEIIVSYFKEDLKKYYFKYFGSTNPRKIDKIKLCYCHLGLHCVLMFRFTQFAYTVYSKHRLKGLPLKILASIIRHIFLMLYQVEISTTSKIQPGFFISHIGNIHINAEKIGENCTMTHNITIGHNFRNNKTLPCLGKNIWIGPGSVIVGKLKVGDNVTISAGTILTKSVPDNCLVSGNPARIIIKNYRNDYLIQDGRQKLKGEL